MNTHQPDFVSVDMRGLKAALVERAQIERVSVSVLVRRAVARELGMGGASLQAKSGGPLRFAPDVSTVKLSIRLTTDEADRLVAGAQSAGLSRGAYLAGLVAEIPFLTSGFKRSDQLAELAETNAHLSSLSRNVHALTRFLTLGDVPQALVYRDMLNRLDGDVRRHLSQAAALLADLHPHGHTAEARRRSYR
ncbi:hypothetical protein KIH07_17305 [Hydrogenophaga taeniospiralis]|jgi:hypothetical protein|uniref:hypothetical protein n=1 Tax=Hydrogenophaga taeniospiralis TaxID=65656 RepID=UPI001CF97DC7|nr:hypothetical protein [Hydrogenophaga taeniospiralis]MCB4365500.1 hypothetical protein [Hydrogenophaga taeniospiralis]